MRRILKLCMKMILVLSLLGITDTVYAADPISACTKGAWIGAWTTIGDLNQGGFIGVPRGIVGDSKGNVYVADDLTYHSIKMRSADGIWSQMICPFSGIGNEPFDLAIDNDDNLYVVNKINVVSMYGVWKYTSATKNWTDITKGETFNNPESIAVDKNGTVYVTDTGNNKIKKLPNGSGSWQTIGDGTFNLGVAFDQPRGIAVDDALNVYVVFGSNPSYLYVLQNGQTRWKSFHEFNPDVDGANSRDATDISIDRFGNIYIAKTANSEISVLKKGSNRWAFMRKGKGQGKVFSNIHGVGVDRDGNVYVTDKSCNFNGEVYGSINKHQGWANNLVWEAQPSNAFTGQPILKAGTVLTLVDEAGNKMASVSDLLVRVSLTNASGAVLSGTKTATINGGQATLPTDLCVDKPGTYTLTATIDIPNTNIWDMGNFMGLPTSTINGLSNSFTATVQPKAGPPSTNPASGTNLHYKTPVTLSCYPSNGTIYYTMDGTIPTINSLSCSSGTKVAIPNNPSVNPVLINAFTVVPDYINSDIAEFTFDMNYNPNEPPSAKDMTYARRIAIGHNKIFNANDIAVDVENDPLTITEIVGVSPEGRVEASLQGNSLKIKALNSGIVWVKVKVADAYGSVDVNMPFSVQSDQKPYRKGGIPPRDVKNISVNANYTLDLASIFENIDDGPLNYKVSINAGVPVAANANYSYSPQSAGETKLIFQANNGLVDSEDTYTVSLIAHIPASITMQPIDKTVNLGDNVTFTVAATGDGALNYYWKKDNVSLINAGRFNGVYTPSMTISNVQVSDLGSYSCFVMSPWGNATSNAAELLMNGTSIVNAYINPSQVSFNLDTPANVSTAITWNGATAITGVRNGTTPLDTSAYSVSGNILTIKQSYLSGLGMNEGDEINLSISFDAGNVTLKVTAVKNHIPSTDASLSNLMVGSTTITGFAVNKYDYSVELPHGTQPSSEVAKVTATAQDAKATLVITQATQLPGTAKVKVTAEDTSSSQEYTINFTVQTTSNHAPKRKATVPAETAANVEVNSPYSLDLSTIFEDEDSNALTYKVSVDNEATVTASANYSYTPPTAGTTRLVFTTNDGKADSSDTYKVTLTATEAVVPDIASVNAAKDAIQDGTVKVGIDATQDDRTAAVQSYVNNIISNTANANGVTAIVTHSSGNQYNVALSKGSVNEDKSLTMTIVEAAPITVSSMSVKTSPSKITYIAGEKLTLAGLVVTLHQDTNTSEDIAFEDFAGSGITISPANGTVLTTTDTEVTITHKTSGKSVKENITVNPASSVIWVTGITLNPKNITLYSNTTSNTAILATTIAPSDATDKGVSWQSSNTAIATVDAAGKVSAVSNGIATITATTADGGYTDSCMVTVTTYNSGTNSGSGGSSSGGTTIINPITNIPTDKQLNMPTVAKINISGIMNDDVLSVTITKQMVKDAIKAAQDAARKFGKEADGISVDFNVIGSGSYTNLNVSIDEGVVARLKESGVKFIKIGSAILDVSFDTSAISELDKQSTGTVTVSARKLTKLTYAAKKLIGNRPVFDITISYKKNGKTEFVSNFGMGIVTLGIVYEATGKENKGNLFGVYVDKNGKPQLLTNSSYDNTGRLIFSRNSLSTYGVGYKATAPAFTDTTNHWAKDHIDFVVSHDLITGSSENTFAPNTAITRADFLMALGRLSGEDVSIYKTSSFTDVKDTDTTMPYIEWAVKNKIVQGIGDGKFGSGEQISRQDIAVMMQNYATTTGYELPVSRQSITFDDDAKISAYAKAAVNAIQQTGVVGGKANNLFDPKGNATRAEASTILRRFVELVIDGK